MRSLRNGALIGALALAAAGCGGSPKAAPPAALVIETVGRGVQKATILRPAGPRRALPAVLFLHGWGATEPAYYRPWLEHLARRGNAVIYPRYQDSALEPPRQVLGNVLAAVRLAVARQPVARGTLVAAGHSAGGALAADYAAVARAARLPVPRAVFAAYPGRRLPRVPFGLPVVAPHAIPRSTLLEVLAGRHDRVVGTATARAMVRQAPQVAHRRLVYVGDARVADHLGPQRASAAARGTFWAALDRLIQRARR